MERRKGIPLVALVIFIALLVAIILTCIIILGSNKSSKPAVKKQQVASQPEQPPEEIEEKIEEELTDEDIINNDQDVQTAYKLTGNNKAFAKYAIYSSTGFNSEEDNISNEIKLQLAMAQVTNSDMDAQSSKKAVSKEVIDEYIETIFGDSSDIEYKDFSLYNSDINFTEQYKTIGYMYKKDSSNYEVNENDIIEEEPSEIPEVITKVVKYNTKMEIYVKPLFIETIYDADENRYLRGLYTDYNFSAKQFPIDKSIMTITNDDYKNVVKSNYKQDIDGLNYKEVNQNIDLNQLTEYKYTLIKVDDGYNLQSFEQNTKNKKKEGKDEDKEMTEQEKAIFNGQFDAYTGNGKSAEDAKTVLSAVISSNEANSDKKDLIVTVKIGDEEAALEDDDVDALNEKIEELESKIDSSKEYYIKETYKSGIIISITITEE
ncbi:MAG: hypothetical protein HFJ44_04215 [Clostridia bacterium]|jgi:hypothetical protein|nr:hypothetical protein [Clostridia bacterium]